MVNVSGESPHNNWINSVFSHKTEKQSSNSNEITNVKPEEISTLWNPDNATDLLPIKRGPLQINPKIFEIYPDPKVIVDNIRNSNDQNAKNKGLIEFQGKIDQMPLIDLKITRDYLINLMESPFNKDDDLLFLLLKTVNKRLDNGHFNTNPPGYLLDKIPCVMIEPPPLMFD